MLGDPVSLNMDEFQKVATTPVPERLDSARNAFILQLCTGCRGEEFKQLSLRNVAVSPEGIPYIQYTFRTTKKGKVGKNEYEVEVPLVRIAFDIVLRTRFQFVFGSYNMIYNNAIQELLRFCGIRWFIRSSRRSSRAAGPILMCCRSSFLWRRLMRVCRSRVLFCVMLRLFCGLGRCLRAGSSWSLWRSWRRMSIGSGFSRG